VQETRETGILGSFSGLSIKRAVNDLACFVISFTDISREQEDSLTSQSPLNSSFVDCVCRDGFPAAVFLCAFV